VNDEYSEKKSAFETVSDAKAVEQFRDDPEGALAGGDLVSIETDPDAARVDAIRAYAQEKPAEFLEAARQLPLVLQDIVYQFYLLGRTQTHIAETLNLTQKQVWQHLRLALEGIGYVLKGDRIPDEIAGIRGHCRKKFARTDDALGAFVFHLDPEDVDSLLEHFAPMTTGGPIDVEETDETISEG